MHAVCCQAPMPWLSSAERFCCAAAAACRLEARAVPALPTVPSVPGNASSACMCSKSSPKQTSALLATPGSRSSCYLPHTPAPHTCCTLAARPASNGRLIGWAPPAVHATATVLAACPPPCLRRRLSPPGRAYSRCRCCPPAAPSWPSRPDKCDVCGWDGFVLETTNGTCVKVSPAQWHVPPTTSTECMPAIVPPHQACLPACPSARLPACRLAAATPPPHPTPTTACAAAAAALVRADPSPPCSFGGVVVVTRPLLYPPLQGSCPELCVSCTADNKCLDCT